MLARTLRALSLAVLLSCSCEAEDTKPAPTPQPRKRVQRNPDNTTSDYNNGETVVGKIRTADSWYVKSVLQLIQQRYKQLASTTPSNLADREVEKIEAVVRVDLEKKRIEVVSLKGTASLKTQGRFRQAVEQCNGILPDAPKAMLEKGNLLESEVFMEFGMRPEPGRK